MENTAPKFLIDLLKKEYDLDLVNKILEGYSIKRYTTFRVNTLKSCDKEVLDILDSMQVKYIKYDAIEHAYILPNRSAKEFYDTKLVSDGLIYFQSLSSMLPPLFLDIKETDTILDMAAAPGGKTTMMAALSNGKAQITACEVNKIRAERLKHNIEVQNAKNVFVMRADAKMLDDFFSFDKILLDAPCSGSGTIDLNNRKALKAFSYDLVKNSAHLQYELLKKAIQILKPNSCMVYSTCSILPIENEEIISRALKEFNIEIVPIEFRGLPLLPTKIEGCLLVLPNEYFEGFFIAKIRKK